MCSTLPFLPVQQLHHGKLPAVDLCSAHVTKDGADFQGFPTAVDPTVLVINTTVDRQPCYCYRPTCEQCYNNVSPAWLPYTERILSC
jgi:hypothetical protein